MKKFFLIPNTVKDEDLLVTKKVISWLTELQLEVHMPDDIAKEYGLSEYGVPKDYALKEADCAIVLGGDGTIISAARELALYNLPILGINLGRLGFLAEIEVHQSKEAFMKIAQKEFFIQERMMLDTTLKYGHKKQILGHALNDLVITRTAISRMVGFRIYVNNELVNDYYADGIIISTPTGSTAYNLSAGGPILAPYNEMIVVTPICPHSLKTRSLVLSGEDQIRITFENSKSMWEEERILTLDGQEVHNIGNGTTIHICKSNIKTKLLKLNDSNFYSLLRKKLG